MISLRILGVVIVSVLTLAMISLSSIPVTFGTSVPQDLRVCPPGSYLVLGTAIAPATGVEACQRCPAGYYCPNSGMGPTDPPIPCPTGFTCPVGTITPIAIPEYPLGVAVLAIFMIIAYGVIRRKTITKQK